MLRACELFTKAPVVLCFQTEVELLLDRSDKLVHQFRQRHSFHSRQPRQRFRNESKNAHVVINHARYSRPANFHRYLATILQPSAMDLSDACRSDRLELERVEELVQRASKSPLNNFRSTRTVERRDLI